METVTLPCTHCGQVMAVAVGDLGRPVECPHCWREVTPQDPAAEPEIRVPSVAEQESIFAPPEESSGDDLFGAAPTALRLELPPEPAPVPPPEAAPPPAAEAPAVSPFEPPPPRPPDPAPRPEPATAPTPLNPFAPDAVAPARRVPARGAAVPLLLIFLIPYSVVTTAA